MLEELELEEDAGWEEGARLDDDKSSWAAGWESLREEELLEAELRSVWDLFPRRCFPGFLGSKVLANFLAAFKSSKTSSSLRA